MGAWSHEPFGNDIACDWLYELEETADLSMVVSTIEDAELSAEDLDATEAQEAIAAIEVVAKILGKSTQNDAYTESPDLWISKINEKPDEPLIKNAITVLDSVVSENSELAELWEGQEEWLMSIKKQKAVLNDVITSSSIELKKDRNTESQKNNVEESLVSASTIDRSEFMRLEKPIDLLSTEIELAYTSVLTKHPKVLAAIKSIQKDYAAIKKEFYSPTSKVRGGAFAKLIAIWGEHGTEASPITKENIKEIEKELGHSVSLPPTYKRAVLKCGIPTFSDELVNRLQDIKELDSVIPDNEDDYPVSSEAYMPIKRFLTPQEIVEKTLLISRQTEKPPTDVAIAIDKYGYLLCYKNCVKPAPDEPPHEGEPDLIYDPHNHKIIKEDSFGGEFKEWIAAYSYIKPLNINEEVISSLKVPITNMHKTINSLLEEQEYLEHKRYHNMFEKISQNIHELFDIYSRNFQ